MSETENKSIIWSRVYKKFSINKVSKSRKNQEFHNLNLRQEISAESISTLIQDRFFDFNQWKILIDSLISTENQSILNQRSNWFQYRYNYLITIFCLSLAKIIDDSLSRSAVLELLINNIIKNIKNELYSKF